MSTRAAGEPRGMERQARELWGRYQQGLEPQLDVIVLLFAGFFGLGTLLNFFTANWLFVTIDGVVSGTFIVVYVARRGLSVLAKVSLTCVVGLLVSMISFLRSGLVGTGVITVLATNVIAIVFLTIPPAVVVSACATVLILVAGGLVASGAWPLPSDVGPRNTNLAEWIIHATAVAGLSTLAMIAVNSLRTRMLSGILELEHTNRELERTNHRIERLAYYDPLTALPNRNLFRRHIEARIADGAEHAHVLTLDLRRFRVFNSLYGAQRGDHLLHAFGEMLARYREHGIFAARLSGDEFAAWVEGWSADTLESNIERLRNDIRDSMSTVDAQYLVDYFVAVAEYPDDGDSSDELLANVGIALRAAKDRDTPALTRYTMAMAAAVDEGNELDAALRRGLDRDEFYPVYQPKIELQSGAVVGVEALARWTSSELGEVPPAQFVPALVRVNLMTRFSEMMFDRILADVPAIQSRFGADASVSINVSPVQLLQPGFETAVLERIAEVNVAPSVLTFEVTEDVFVGDIDHVRRIIQALRDHGIRVALDDFGKGFSSLYYIRSIPFSELKVDKSFIDDIPHDAKSRQLFDAICTIATTYGYGVVAEGVETEEQVVTLRDTSCTVVQGYYFARPAPV